MSSDDPAAAPPLYYAKGDKRAARARAEPLLGLREGRLEAGGAGLEVLRALPEREPVAPVMVFGAARTGKSFLMNALLGAPGVFRVANSADPCTRGVDVASWTPRHAAAVEALGAAWEAGMPPSPPGLRLAMVDVEGQGDRGEQSDTMLALPLLLTARVCVFNHKGAPTVAAMLSTLGVLATAANYVDDGAGGGGFGHLHVVFRDFAFEGTADEVREQLLGHEKVTVGLKGATPDQKAARERNDLRDLLVANFRTISVHLLRQPAGHDVLKAHAEVPEELVAPEFAAGVRRLATQILAQAAEPSSFGGGGPLTGPRLATLYPELCRVINETGLVSVPSVYRAMERETLARVAAAILVELAAASARTRESLPLAPEDLDRAAADAEREALAAFDEETGTCLLEEEKAQERGRIAAAAAEALEELRAANEGAVERRARDACAAAYARLRAAFAEWCEAAMPVEEEDELDGRFNELEAAAVDALAAELAGLPQAQGLPAYAEALAAAREAARGDLALRRVENASRRKDAELQRLRDDMIRQQEEMIEQNKKLQEFLEDERGNTAAMEKRLADLKAEKDRELAAAAAERDAEKKRAEEAERQRDANRKALDEERSKSCCAVQ